MCVYGCPVSKTRVDVLCTVYCVLRGVRCGVWYGVLWCVLLTRPNTCFPLLLPLLLSFFLILLPQRYEDVKENAAARWCYVQLQQIVEVGDATTTTKSHMEDTVKGAITRKMTTSGGLVDREEEEVMDFVNKEKSRVCSCPCFPCFGKGVQSTSAADGEMGEMVEMGAKYERV